MNIIVEDKSYKNICACTYMPWCAKCGYYILFPTTQPSDSIINGKDSIQIKWHMLLAIMKKINELSTSKHLWLECFFFQFTDGTTVASIPRQTSTELTTLLQGLFKIVASRQKCDHTLPKNVIFCPFQASFF